MPKPGDVDRASLEIGRRYRVDHRNVELRRSFRFTGVLLAIDDEPSPEPGGGPVVILTFEEKPRFAPATRHRIDLAAVVSAEPR
jgi:hypothetical protein